ncbi:hypothetical protein [Winogradskyella flava]|uniref:Uncharacterized protein n=1 Tax=Winogradskyella flava TaxID=1884876 RepID=A0A842IUD4_9FLAO|nr:hypothetical protein [Winogradskyella flava]MBC2846571.1 hypothetical protein [Winogradskyella flava]
MKFNRVFYDSRFNIKSVSKKRIILSISIGLASAIFIYSFFTLFREYFRMMNLDFENRPIVISDVNRNFHNLFFAAISLIFGNSIAIGLLISSPQSALSKRNIKRGRIINDQVFLAFNFIYWFGKIWVFLGVFSFLTIGFDYIENLMIPAILLVVVLYLESWKTLIQVLKRNRWKIQMMHFGTLTILTFGLSQLNVFDYKSFDENMLVKKPTINVPKSVFHDELYKKRYYDKPVFKIDFNHKGQVGLFNEQYDRIELHDVYYYIQDWHDEIPREYEYKSVPRLRANKSIPIKYVKEFEFSLYNSGKFQIIYEVANNEELTNQFYNNQIKYSISPSLHEAFPREPHEPPRPPYFDYINELNSSDTIFVNVGETVVFDNRIVKPNDLVTEFQRHIDSLTVFEYVYKDDTTYQDYINVLSAHSESVLKLKKRNSKIDYDQMINEIYNNQFSSNEKHRAELRRLDEKFQIIITERFE